MASDLPGAAIPRGLPVTVPLPLPPWVSSQRKQTPPSSGMHLFLWSPPPPLPDFLKEQGLLSRPSGVVKGITRRPGEG